MFKCPSRLPIWSALTCLIGAVAYAAPTANKPTYGFGMAATPAQIAGWNIDVRPDGTGLTVGHGSVEEGQTVYDAKCAVCHGTFGESGDYIQLAGGVGSLHTQTPVRTVGSLLSHATTLWDYINRAMPFPNSKSLTANEVYAVTAYVLNLSDVIKAGTTLDEKSLPQLKMPNQDGFTTDHGFKTVAGKPDVLSAECMANCAVDVKVTSQLPAGFVAQNYGDISQQFRGITTMSADVGAPAAATGNETPAKKDGYTLAQVNGCTACHGVDQKIVGPALKDVAAKYRSSAGALDTLTLKVRGGGSGVWGSIPMPPQTAPSDPDLKVILMWVLAGASAS
jgi:cytochrome c551/c552